MKNKNTFLSVLIIVALFVGCSPSKKEEVLDQLYFIHIGESDKVIEDVLIYVDHDAVIEDVDSSFLTKYKVNKNDFVMLNEYVSKRNTKHSACQSCGQGSFQIRLISSEGEVGYVIDDTLSAGFYRGLFSLIKSNKELQRWMTSRV